jgi:hypothetical protein
VSPCWRWQEKRPQTKNRRSILGRAKCDRRARRSNTRTLRAQPAQHRSERNAPTRGPSRSPRNPQRLSASNRVKTKDNLRPPMMCGLNQWIGGARRPSRSAKMRDRGQYRQAAGVGAEAVTRGREYSGQWLVLLVATEIAYPVAPVAPDIPIPRHPCSGPH